MKTAKQLELLLMVKELEIQQLKKRIQELENDDNEILSCIYGQKGTGKRYYERNKDKTKNNKRTRSARWNS